MSRGVRHPLKAALLAAAVTILELTLAPTAGSAQQAGSATDVPSRLARADAAYDSGDSRTAEAEYAAVAALHPRHSRAVYRLAELRRARDLDAAIALYRRYVELEPGDAWGYLALANALSVRGDLTGSRIAYAAAMRLAPRERDVHVGRARMLARAGFAAEAARAYEAWLALSPNDAESRRELARARRRSAAWVEPAVGGTRDSDGITTWLTGVSVASSDLGRARLLASVGRGVAGDPLVSRGSFNVRVGTVFRPIAALRLELDAGTQRVDRAFIDTASTPGGSGPGGGIRGGRPSAPIGRTPGARGGATELIPVGRARLVWRDPAGRWRIDARASRQVLDASPYLVAQGVRRDEIGGELDLRVAGPLRVRALGRLGTVHNDAEANKRRLVGAALAWAPATFEVSLRGQELSYGSQTGLAYFAPRYVRTLEFTTYFERELGDVQLAFDAGAGAQQVAAWTEVPTNWSPTARVWAQLAKPLTSRVSLGADGEAYDSRVGTDMPSLEVPAGRWRYGSLRVWLRATM
jgi:hypothetical protein